MECYWGKETVRECGKGERERNGVEEGGENHEHTQKGPWRRREGRSVERKPTSTPRRAQGRRVEGGRRESGERRRIEP